MKAGDKLYCTKKFNFGIFIFKKGKIYDLLENKDDTDLNVCLIDEKSKKLTFHDESPLFKQLPQHFILLQESRKLKLNKLNEHYK